MNLAVEYFLRYLKVERNASNHTIEAYQRDILQFFSFAHRDTSVSDDASSDEVLQTTEPLTIRLWLGTLMEQGLGRASIARKAASLRSFFKYCHQRGIIEKNPAQLLIIPKQAKRIPTVISKSEMDNLLDKTVDDSAWATQENAMLELFYSTGIRLSELTALNLHDVDLKQRQIRVLGKGQKQRIIPIGEKARDSLTQHLSSRSELIGVSAENISEDDVQALFLTKRGKRMYSRLVQKLVKKRIDEVSEVTKQSPHVLRHSFATHMLNAGADIRLIKEFLGHSSLAATQIYTHTGVEHLKKIHEQSHPRAKNSSQSEQQKQLPETNNGDRL